jgi:hypothetical protein
MNLFREVPKKGFYGTGTVFLGNMKSDFMTATTMPVTTKNKMENKTGKCRRKAAKGEKVTKEQETLHKSRKMQRSKKISERGRQRAS